MMHMLIQKQLLAYKTTLQHDFKIQYRISKKGKMIYTKIFDLNVKRSFIKGSVKYRLH